jgi:hypothetical protein
VSRGFARSQLLQTADLARITFVTADSPTALGHVLGEGSRCDLRELSLVGCGLTPDHAEVIAAAPGMRSVWALDLTEYAGLPPAAVEAVFSSPNLRSVTRLSLCVGGSGLTAAYVLAMATGWDRLHTLGLQATGLPTDALLRFLDSPPARHLARLSVEDAYNGTLTITPRSPPASPGCRTSPASG